MKALVVVMGLLVWSGGVHAQAPEPLRVFVADGSAVHGELLRAALSADLEVTVLEAPLETASLVVDRDSEGGLRLRVRLFGQAERSRTMVEIEDGREVTLAVALIAANLVRDEASELLALLNAARERREEVPVVVLAPAAELGRRESQSESEPESASESESESESASESESESEAVLDVFGLDFLPGLGSSSAYGVSHRRSFSVGVVGGLSGGIEGLALSGVLDIAGGAVNGAQMAGVVAVAGPVSGLQSGVLSVSGGALDGVQLGVVAISGPVTGLQLGIVEIAGGDVDGAQLGLVSIGGAVRGAQLGLVNIAAGDVNGAQLGLVNIAAGRVHGAQIGLLNIAEEADAAIGLVSLQARSENHLRISGESTGLLGLEFVHGNTTHMIVSAAVQPFQETPALVVGVGLGARVDLAESLHLDIEGLGRVVINERSTQEGPDGLVELRVLLGVEVFAGLGLYGGLSYQILLGSGPTPDLSPPVLQHTLIRDSVQAWPSLVVGLEVF